LSWAVISVTVNTVAVMFAVVVVVVFAD